MLLHAGGFTESSVNTGVDMHCTHFCLLLAFAFPVLTTGSWQDTVWCSTTDDVSCSTTLKRDTYCDCPLEDSLCEKDKLGYEAICQLHRQIDDDHNGNLDRSESDEFIRDELNYKDGFDRQSAFHGSDDLISVSDLWRLWIKSPVYNWTTDDVVDWLVTYVELPQYAHNFRVNGVDGHMLPRIAVMNGHYVGSILGIKNSVHKKKLAVKAMDIVMFGPPKRHSYLKDLALIGSLVVAVGGCWLAYVQHSYSQTQMKKVMKDLDHLQASEHALAQLHQKLDVAQKEHKNIAEEKQKIERILKEEMNTAKHEAERLREVREATAEEISRLKLAEDELVQVRKALRKAEKDLEDSSKAPLAQLQHWLQLNYEIENKHFEMKKESAEKELENAKEMCEKMRKKRSAFLGSLRIAHSASLDETDRKIMNARASLEDVKLDLQERSSRWYEIEKICGFSIVANPGLHTLSAMLNKSTGYLGYSSTSNLMSGLSGSVMSMGLGDSEEEQPPGYFAATGRTAHEHMVMTELLRAGMQLSLFGISNPNHQILGGSRRKHTSSSNYNTSFGSIPVSSSTFSLTTKRRNLQPEKDSQTGTHEQNRFLSSVKTQPELFNLEKSKPGVDLCTEKPKLTSDVGKLDGFKPGTDHLTDIPVPRQSVLEPHKASLEACKKLGQSFDKINSESSNHSIEPFRISQESFRIGRESFKIEDFAQDDYKVRNDIFKDVPAAFKTAFKGSKDLKVETKDHGDTPYKAELEGRPHFDLGDQCPQYEDLEENIGKMQVSCAKSGLVHSLHQNEQLYFQKSLPSSLSDTSLLMVGPEVVKNKPLYPTKRISPRSHLAMVLDEDISSPESTDSTGPQDKPKKKRLSRRTLLPKLLKNSPLVDKQKVC